MTDDTLTDHEWKTKMAAEGKAVYVPGKTVEEVGAETAQSGTGSEVSLTLTGEDADRFFRAADDAVYLYGQARDMCELLWDGLSGGMLHGDEPGLLAILDFASRAFDRATQEDGAALAELADILRREHKKEVAA